MSDYPQEVQVHVEIAPPAMPEGLSRTQLMIVAECDAIKEMLLQKNRRYGSSALNPVRIFSKASPEEQILVRLDDKVSRLTRGSGDEDEDVWKDLIGYMVLLRVCRKMTKDE